MGVRVARCHARLAYGEISSNDEHRADALQIEATAACLKSFNRRARRLGDQESTFFLKRIYLLNS